MKTMRDFRSSIECLPGSTTTRVASPHNTDKENRNPHLER